MWNNSRVRRYGVWSALLLLLVGLLVLVRQTCPDVPTPSPLLGDSRRAYTTQEEGGLVQNPNETYLIRVVDGDTLVISAPYLPPPLKPHLLLRIYGVNTPERGWRAACTDEHLRADLAYQFVQTCLFEGEQSGCDKTDYRIILRKWDKYGGRVLGDVYFYRSKLWLSEIIIKHGHGTVYFGAGPKYNWCSDEGHDTTSQSQDESDVCVP